MSDSVSSSGLTGLKSSSPRHGSSLTMSWPHLVFLDESGFLLIPNVARTWVPKGSTPIVRCCSTRSHLGDQRPGRAPKRRRLALYLHLRTRNLIGLDVRAFLNHLLRQLLGPVVLLWDRGTIPSPQRGQTSGSDAIQRLQVEPFPAYAPELNPAEYVWN